MPRHDGRTALYAAYWGDGRKRKHLAHRRTRNPRALRKHGRRFGKGVKGIAAYRRANGLDEEAKKIEHLFGED